MRSGKYYKKLTIKGRKVDEHRYKLEQRLGRELSYNEIAHHIDEDINNNNDDNIELMSRSEHTRLHASNRVYSQEHRDKMRMLGIEKMPNRKLNEAQVIEIRKKYSEGEQPRDLQLEYKIEKSTFYNIIYRNTWKHIA